MADKIQELKDIANKLRIHSINQTSAAKSGLEITQFYCSINLLIYYLLDIQHHVLLQLKLCPSCSSMS